MYELFLAVNDSIKVVCFDEICHECFCLSRSGGEYGGDCVERESGLGETVDVDEQLLCLSGDHLRPLGQEHILLTNTLSQLLQLLTTLHQV